VFSRGAIGDLILPGLGILGGAILGGVGRRYGSKNRDGKGNIGRSRSERRLGRFRRRIYKEE
jgi:hypothetical protein